MSLIPQITIEQITNAADIVDVVKDFTSLKKKGQNFWACCPFHEEKTPSFSVSPQLGIFKCFGCGKGGDSVSFIMEIEKLNYADALRFLARKYGITIPEKELTQEELAYYDEKDSLLLINNFAQKYYSSQLRESEEGRNIGLSYFKERGFTEDIINKFQLGFSHETVDSFCQTALKAGFARENLEKIGLIISKENYLYDRFRSRVIFPIHDVSGKIIGFGGRVLKADDRMAKYINSPDSIVYHKSEIVYGIYFAKNAIRNEDNCYLVEGYTDVIAMHQAGIVNTVASSGTSLTEDQIRLIGRFSKNITVIYDGDPAGIKASLRGIDMILEKGLNVNAVLLPTPEDPDSFCRKNGGEHFKKYIYENEKDFITFKTDLLKEEINKNPIKKAEIINEILNSISKIPDIIKRAVFVKKCSQLLEIDELILIKSLNKFVISNRENENNYKFPKPTIPTYSEIKDKEISSIHHPKPAALNYENSEKEIVRLLINYSTFVLNDNETLQSYLLKQLENITFNHPVFNDIIQIFLDGQIKGHKVDLNYFKNTDNNKIKEIIAELATRKYEPSQEWIKYNVQFPAEENSLSTIVVDAQLRMQWKHIQKLIGQNLEKMKDSGNAEELEEIQKMHICLKEMEKEITAHLGIVVF